MNMERFYTMLAAFATSLLVVLLGYIIIGVHKDLRDYEGRIATVENTLNICVDCGGKRKQLGGFDWATSREHYVDEETGRVQIAFDIDILSEQFRWKCGSFGDIVRGDERIDLSSVISGYTQRQHLDDALGIVALGTGGAGG